MNIPIYNSSVSKRNKETKTREKEMNVPIHNLL